MKKISIFVMLFLNISTVDARKCYQTIKFSGQTDPVTKVTTYARVEEADPVYNSSNNTTTYSLLCMTPGTMACKFKDGTPGLVIAGSIYDYDAGNNYVQDQISMGNLSGGVLADNGVDELTWSAVDEDNYEFSIFVEP